MAMNKQTFDSFFEQHVSEPLENSGFMRSENSFFINEDPISVSLIRLGGKFASPGTIAHILCFRHSFLPNLNKEVPEGFEKEVFAYPFKLKPSDVVGLLSGPIKYKSQNLNYDYERYNFTEQKDKDVTKYLSKVHDAVVKVLNWSKSTEVKKIAQQIQKHNESAWIEKLWLGAYSKQGAI